MLTTVAVKLTVFVALIAYQLHKALLFACVYVYAHFSNSGCVHVIKALKANKPTCQTVQIAFEQIALFDPC